jgi:CheY-like chemotaxis protein
MENNNEKKKILIIDDDVIFLTIAESMVSDKYMVFTAKSGKEALFDLIKIKPDLILLDIVMPEMDGWELFRKIKGISLLQEIPIAFVTSLSETAGLKQAQFLGASGYILKPIEKNKLLSDIEKLLSGETLN